MDKVARLSAQQRSELFFGDSDAEGRHASCCRKGLLGYLGAQPAVPGTGSRAVADVQGWHQSIEGL